MRRMVTSMDIDGENNIWSLLKASRQRERRL